MFKNRLAEIEYWANIQGDIDLHLPENSPVRIWLNNNFDFSNINNCFEIGCYPGRYLNIFAEKGIEVNGIDYLPHTKQLKQVFSSKSLKVGEIFCEDFLSTSIERKFDCVCSFGFIEHFSNWEEVLLKHDDFLKDQGYLIIEVPNFKGFFQRFIRILFDYKNYNRHNVSSMNLEKWKKLLLQENYEILDSQYFGGYLLWFENPNQNRTYLFLRNRTIKILSRIKNLIFKGEKESKHFSAALGIIAFKKEKKSY